jgi:glucosamine-6-phosphate deaminase
MSYPIRAFQVDKAQIKIYPSKYDASQAAATEAAAILRRATAARGRARVIVGTGVSQDDLIRALVQIPGLDWAAIEIFHMDEYVGMPVTHPASFRRWLNTRLVDLVHPGQVQYLAGDAGDVDQECQRYGDSLRSAPIDLCLIGFGENGHIAFNDPHVADFNDPLAVKRVDLDEQCRRQQLGEGQFPTLEAVPREAITLTCPVLMSAEYLIGCVPERRKAEAVRNALEGPITTRCPASRVRMHPRAALFFDVESASLLSQGSP